jgi:co-chaperonin GroES (HSP10)
MTELEQFTPRPDSLLVERHKSEKTKNGLYVPHKHKKGTAIFGYARKLGSLIGAPNGMLDKDSIVAYRPIAINRVNLDGIEYDIVDENNVELIYTGTLD